MSTSPLTAPKTVPDMEELASAERRARRFWMSVVVGLLGLQVFIGVGSVWLSLGDPSVAIVPNYHQKALDWDATQRARHLPAKLGWQIETHVGSVAGVEPLRSVHVDVRDAGGQSIQHLNITGRLYHHARGADVHVLQFVESSAGDYRSMTSLVAPGMWQVQLQIEGEHGIASDTRDIIVP